jgi:hypothetical protein
MSSWFTRSSIGKSPVLLVTQGNQAPEVKTEPANEDSKEIVNSIK